MHDLEAEGARYMDELARAPCPRAGGAGLRGLEISPCHEPGRHSVTKRRESGKQIVRFRSPEDDWTDPKVWKEANPSFGITLSADQFAGDCKEAQESPAKENSFRRYRLNQ